MDFKEPDDHKAIRSAVEQICARFPLDYWLEKDRNGGFPHDFHKAFADAGWLGIAMPQEYGGAGLGISEAAVIMETVAASGAGLAGAAMAKSIAVIM